MHTKQIIRTGKQTGEATKALVMLHGRGGSAEDILGLSNYLPVKDFALFAPQATNNALVPVFFSGAAKRKRTMVVRSFGPGERHRSRYSGRRRSTRKHLFSRLFAGRLFNAGIRYPQCYPLWWCCSASPAD